VSTCQQFREWAEAYALGALDASQRAALESHLATGCQDCRKAVEEARWVVSQLAHWAPETAPSVLLKGRLLQTVRAEAKAAETATQAQTGTPWWMWGAIAALLLFAVMTERATLQLRTELREAEHQAANYQKEIQDVEAKLELAKRENVILTDSASVKIKLAEAGPEQPRVDAIWHAKLGIVLTAENIPAPAGGRVFQLWLIPKDPNNKPVPSAVVRPDEDGRFTLLVANPPGDMAETRSLAITEEPAGGSLLPTSPVKWVGTTR